MTTGKELLELSEVKRVDLKDGDILAVYCPTEPDEYQAHEMTERLKAGTGLAIKVMILPPGFEIGVVREERVTG